MNRARAAAEPVDLQSRPTVGTAAAARSFAEDVSALVRAEVELAKAEVVAGVRPKAVGGGLIAAVAALVWFAAMALLLAVGFALAEVAGLPGWASALIVAGGLLVIAAILAVVARSKLATPVGLDVTKRNVQEDVAWTRQRLRTP